MAAADVIARPVLFRAAPLPQGRAGRLLAAADAAYGHQLSRRAPMRTHGWHPKKRRRTTRRWLPRVARAPGPFTARRSRPRAEEEEKGQEQHRQQAGRQRGS